MTPELTSQLFQIVLIPLLGALTAFAVKWIKARTEAIQTTTENETLDKYLSMLSATVIDCVMATNQTYVETLKKQGSFDEEAQKEAFKQTYVAVLTILGDDAKDYLTAAVGDFHTYLTKLIEAEVKRAKM
jgi:hypothetical protein